MAKKSGYYAVQNGRQAGIYSNWQDCKSQVDGFSGARYKRFDTLAESQAFVGHPGRNSRSSENSSNTSGHASYSQGYVSYPSSQVSYPSSQVSYSSAHVSYPSIDPSHKKPYQNRIDHNLTTRYSSNEGYRISKPKAYYAVRSSSSATTRRIFDNWSECQQYVKGQKGISFKKFENHNEALDFMNGVSNPDVDFGLIGTNSEAFTSKYKVTNRCVKYNLKSTVYCDGSALANGSSRSCAGYGVYFKDEENCNISEPLREGAQTNNRAELQAVSSCLDKIWINLTEKEDKRNYEIKTDSEYVAKLLNDRYTSLSSAELSSLVNGDIAVDLIQKYAKVKQFYEINKGLFANEGQFKIQWVKGHAGEEGNERADELAKAGALKR